MHIYVFKQGNLNSRQISLGHTAGCQRTTLKKNVQAQTHRFGMLTTSGNTCTCVRDALLGSCGVL